MIASEPTHLIAQSLEIDFFHYMVLHNQNEIGFR